MPTYTWQSRESWGAAAPRHRRDDTNPRGVAIHYPGPGRFVFSEHRHCESLMRRWQEMHMARGSLDLEYGTVLCNHLILMEGRIEQDRPWVRVGSNGTAAANYTHNSIQLMRGTLDAPPTNAEIQALGEVVAWYRKHGDWGPEVTGHRDHYGTACPGDPLYRRLGDIRRIADNYNEETDDMPTPAELWNHRIRVPKDTTLGSGKDGKRSAASLLVWSAIHSKAARDEQKKQAAGVRKKIAAIAPSLTADQLDAIEASVRDALVDAVIEVDIDVIDT